MTTLNDCRPEKTEEWKNIFVNKTLSVMTLKKCPWYLSKAVNGVGLPTKV